MIDVTDSSPRDIMTPDGIAELDVIVNDGHAWVWLGKKDKRTNKMRPHREYRIEDLYEQPE